MIQDRLGSSSMTGAFAFLSDAMRMLAFLELEFGSGLFNRLTELRWKSEGLHDRDIEKLFGKQPCEGNQHNRILSRRITRSWLFGTQRLFHNLGNNVRGASCFFVLCERSRHSAKTYGIQTGSFRRQRSDLLFDAAKGFLDSGRIDRTRLHDDDVDALGAQLQPQRRTHRSKGSFGTRQHSSKWRTEMVNYRARVHDAPFRSPQQWQKCLNHADLAKQIHFVNSSYRINRCVLNGTNSPDAGVVK